MATDRLFTGQRLDSTGLYYYGGRYYDPSIGRFISADTIVPEPFNPQSLNRYSYTHNNPLKYTDPSGHLTISVSWSISINYSNFHYNMTISRNHDLYGGLTKTRSEATGVGETSKNLHVALTGELTMTTARTVDDLFGDEVRSGIEAIEIAGTGGEIIHGKSREGNYYIGSTVKIGFGSSAGPYTETVSTSPLFTATSIQIAIYSIFNSHSDLQTAIDSAYNNVASQMGENQIVGWSSDLGYHAVDIDTCSYDWWY